MMGWTLDPSTKMYIYIYTQYNWDSLFGHPRLFFLVLSGNLR